MHFSGHLQYLLIEHKACKKCVLRCWCGYLSGEVGADDWHIILLMQLPTDHLVSLDRSVHQ